MGHGRPEAHRPGLHAARSRRQGHRPREVRRGLSRRRDAVHQAAAQPDAARARAAHRHARGAGDARRQGDPHRRRSAGPARRRARADQRAAVSGRADPRRGRGRRTHGRRGHRAHRRRSRSRCRSSSIPSRACGPAAPTRDSTATSGSRRRPRRPRAAAAAAGPAEGAGAEMDERGFRERARRRVCRWARRPTSGRTAISTPASRAPRSSSTRPSSCSPPDISRWNRAARWPTGRTASSICTARRRASRGRVDPLASWLGIDAVEHRAHQRVLRRRLRQQGRRRDLDGDSGAAVEEGRRAGHDAHQPRRGALHRPRAHRHGRPREGRLQQGRPHHRARPVHRRGQRIVRADGRLPFGGATPRRSSGSRSAMRWRGARGADQHAAALAAALARADAGQRDHGAGRHQGGEEARPRSGGDPPHQFAGRQGALRTRRGRTGSAATSPARS